MFAASWIEEGLPWWGSVVVLMATLAVVYVIHLFKE